MTFWIQRFLVGSRDTVLDLVTSYFGLFIGIGSLVVHYGDGGGEEEESDEEKKEARGEMLSGMAVEERPWWPELASSCGGPRITRGLGGP